MCGAREYLESNHGIGKSCRPAQLFRKCAIIIIIIMFPLQLKPNPPSFADRILKSNFSTITLEEEYRGNFKRFMHVAAVGNRSLSFVIGTSFMHKGGYSALNPIRGGREQDFR